MKKIAICFAAAACLCSCVAYSDADVPATPQEDVSDLLYYHIMEPVFRAAELADFFDRYQDIREDRAASEELAEAYFGGWFDTDNLDYRRCSVPTYWGTVDVTSDPDVYEVSSDHMKEALTVEVIGDRVYRIVCNTDIVGELGVVRLEAEVSVADCGDFEGSVESVRLDSFDALYRENNPYGDTNVRITAGVDEYTVKMQRCSEGSVCYHPYAGRLQFNVSGSWDDLFYVEYSLLGSSVNNISY